MGIKSNKIFLVFSNLNIIKSKADTKFSKLLSFKKGA